MSNLGDELRGMILSLIPDLEVKGEGVLIRNGEIVYDDATPPDQTQSLDSEPSCRLAVPGLPIETCEAYNSPRGDSCTE